MQIQSDEVDNENMKFDLIENSIKDDKIYKEALVQWGLYENIHFASLRFNLSFNEYYSQQFLLDLFNSNEVQYHLPWLSLPKQKLSKIKFNKLKSNLLNMDMFEKLDDEQITRSGSLLQRIEEIHEGISVTTLLRESLLLEESEFYPVWTDEDRSQFLFRIFSILANGGSCCQWDDKIDRYIEFTKLIYKQLICAKKDLQTGTVYSESFVFEIEEIPDIQWKSGEHPQTVLFVVVNPSQRKTHIVYNKWKSFW